jgi:hypothetical protein
MGLIEVKICAALQQFLFCPKVLVIDQGKQTVTFAAKGVAQRNFFCALEGVKRKMIFQ